MAENFSPHEKGLSEKVAFLSRAPFVLSSSGQTTPAATPTPATTPSGRPKLDANFSTRFESEKNAFLASVGVNVANPNKHHLAIWSPVMNLKAATLIDEATDEANRWIDLTLPQLPATSSPTALSLGACLDAALSTHFKTATTAEKITAISSIKDFLTKVKNNPYGINSRKVTYKAGGGWCNTGKMGYTNQTVKTETHLCPDLWPEVFREYPLVTTAAGTLIHEALHRVAWWQFAELTAFGLVTVSGTDIAEGDAGYSALSFGDSLNNADSYAAFARDAANCASAGTSPTPLPSPGATPNP